jgi:hypothetical protein
MSIHRSHQQISAQLQHDDWAGSSELPQVTPEDRAKERAIARYLRDIGTQAEDQCRWLLAIGHTEHSNLGEREKISLRSRMLVYLIARPLEGVSSGRFARHVSDGVLEESGQIPGVEELMLPEDEVERLLAWLKDGLTAIEAGKRFSFEFAVKAAVGFSPWVPKDEHTPLQFFEQTSRRDVAERFADRVCETLRLCGHSIRSCIECKALFVRTHGLSVYCSERCSQRVRTRKWRQGNPEQAREIRRRQYRKDNPRIARHILKRTERTSNRKGD